MEQEPDRATDDPEIAALLTFAPVVRRCRRHDGWTPERQRRFIAALARTGNAVIAAQCVGRSDGGAWKVRQSEGAGEFAAAWDAALDLFHARLPQEPLPPPPPPRPTVPRPRSVHARAARHAPGRGGLRAQAHEARAAGEDVRLASEIEAEGKALLEEILKRYLLKLDAERTARLAGRIVEADYFVRQLTFIELILDIGGHAQEGLAALGNYDCEILRLTATPGSTLLEKARRAIWLEKGEADRPPPVPLGAHDGRCARGEPTEYNAGRDGDFKQWERRQAEKQRLAAEAQAEWERRARGEAPGEPSSPSLSQANNSPGDMPGLSGAKGEGPGDPSSSSLGPANNSPEEPSGPSAAKAGPGNDNGAGDPDPAP